MSDLIRIADAIEAVMAESRKVYTSECANAERIIYEADAVEALSMLPSASVEVDEWIPCSERLPEERGEYLISYHTNFMGECIDIVRYGKPLMPNDEDYKQRDCFYGTSYDGFDVVCRDVTAWMPLPKPYEGSESDE